MFASSRRRTSLDIWPGFVDAMATLLMVIVFVLMTFVVAQLYMTDAMDGTEKALKNIEAQMLALSSDLKNETLSKEKAQRLSLSLQKDIDVLSKKVQRLDSALLSSQQATQSEQKEKEVALASVSKLNAQIEKLTAHIKRLSDALKAEETLKEQALLDVTTIKTELNQALLKKVEELQILNETLKAALQDNTQLSEEIAKLKDPKKLGLTQYRSNFFAKLSKVLDKRSDIRIVGDRFVFQSEVLFDKASAEVKEDGVKQLKTLARTLKDITANIPKDIPWILRIDGHTDKLTMRTKFPSNWELSSARAISVVKALEAEGISPRHLVAAGFGEHQPLAEGDDEEALARNRRIEFKLDQR